MRATLATQVLPQAMSHAPIQDQLSAFKVLPVHWPDQLVPKTGLKGTVLWAEIGRQKAMRIEARRIDFVSNGYHRDMTQQEAPECCASRPLSILAEVSNMPAEAPGWIGEQKAQKGHEPAGST